MTRHPDDYERRGRRPCTATCTTPTRLARRAGRLPRGVLPRALAGLQGLRAARRRGGPRVRPGRGGGGRAADHLPGRARQRAPTSSPRTCAAVARSESLLGDAGVPVTVLRAGIIVGSGGISWEMTRQLVRPPAGDGHAALGAHQDPADRGRRRGPLPRRACSTSRRRGGRVFDIGGPEVLEYVTMLRRVAAIKNRRLLIVPVPLLTPGLSSRWLVAGHRRRHPDRPLTHRLDGQRGRRATTTASGRSSPFEPMGYDDAVRLALSEQTIPDPAGDNRAARA